MDGGTESEVGFFSARETVEVIQFKFVGTSEVGVERSDRKFKVLEKVVKIVFF